MVDHGGGTVFPVIYYDGESETNIGNIRIQPTLIFKPFQFILSQKLGISPNAFSIYLCNNHNNSSDRIPVTNKSNFALICTQMKTSFFLVVLKRSRKSRYRKMKPHAGDLFYEKLQIQKEDFENAMKNYSGSGRVDLDSPNSFPKIEDTLPMMKNKKGVICNGCVNMRRSCGGVAVEFHHCLNDAVVDGWFRSRFGPVIRAGK